MPSPLHYISRDHPNAHELTSHFRHPSQEPCLRSLGAQEKSLRRRCGIILVSRLSPTGTTCNLPMILSTGMTDTIGFRWSSSYTIREPIESNQPKKSNMFNKYTTYNNDIMTIMTIMTIINNSAGFFSRITGFFSRF